MIKKSAERKGRPDLPADPKKAMGALKAPLQLIPSIANEHLAYGLEEGRRKYGFYNWRHTDVEMLTYIGAMKRHIDKIIDGEWYDSDVSFRDLEGKKSHLGAIMACCAILLDADKQGALIDNRPQERGDTNAEGGTE